MGTKAKVKNFFGIDFGTTSSAVVGYSVLEHTPDEFKYGDDEGMPVPSVIAIDKKTGEVYTGREAWDKKMELSESCEYISSVKTMLDQDFEWEIAGEKWTPVRVTAELFRSLKKTVKERTGVEMEKATVAIPIGFSAKKRELLREAADVAGFSIESFISEPTAAFFANYEDLKSSSALAVFDWGGGTLDVSVLQNEKGKISELATGGMNVAGDEIDRKIAQRIHSKIARKNGKEIRFEDMPSTAQDMLLVRSERAKRNLGDDDTTTISINNYGEYGVCRETLDYEWFADIIEPEVNQALECLDTTIHQSGIGIANIDRIVLVGGSSNLRPLLEKMDEKYGDKMFFPEETMWNVGQGAARLAMTPGSYYSNQSIGIDLCDGSYLELLAPDTELTDWHKSYRLGIVDTSQEARFVFGGSPDIDVSPAKNRIFNVPVYGFLQEELDVNAIVDRDLIFQVLAKSRMRTKDYQRVWEYSQLKCYYKLPEGKEQWKKN